MWSSTGPTDQSHQRLVERIGRTQHCMHQGSAGTGSLPGLSSEHRAAITWSFLVATDLVGGVVKSQVSRS